MWRITAALLIATVTAAAATPDVVGMGALGGQPQRQCTLEDSDSCRGAAAAASADAEFAASDDGDGDHNDCRGWALAEAAGERVPDWLERLRSRHPCPADGAAAVAAVDSGAWKDDYCCSRGRGRGSWLSAATAWLRPWLCGGPNCHYHAGADFCVRSPATPLPDGTAAGQQCCYHGDRQALLTNPEAGAGTADRRVDLFGHWSEDVKPFLACCRSRSSVPEQLELASPHCAVYFQRRPPNTGARNEPLDLYHQNKDKKKQGLD